MWIRAAWRAAATVDQPDVSGERRGLVPVMRVLPCLRIMRIVWSLESNCRKRMFFGGERLKTHGESHFMNLSGEVAGIAAFSRITKTCPSPRLAAKVGEYAPQLVAQPE
jgi:hypothetical protein